MDSRKHTRDTNEYAKEFYDSRLTSLRGSYTDERWHSSPIRESEYRQTARALRRALGRHQYGRVLEIGPGDGVWTPLIYDHVAGSAHLVEQSEEMLRRARQRLSSLSNVTFEHSDFLTSSPPGENDLIIAIRCFEYFQHKKEALLKMRELLSPGGRIVIVTKNAELLTRTPVQNEPLRSGQVSRSEMNNLVRDAGLTLEEWYPAVLRFKAVYAPGRFLLELLQRFAVAARGAISMPLLSRYASESYLFVLRREEQSFP